MAQILLLETAASALSVALARDGAVVCERVCTEPRQQASMTAPLVKEVLDEAGVRLQDCAAVAVSSGPGSYTGLRVGVSTAKGLAFGAGLPLISVCTLDILVAEVLSAAPAAAAASSGAGVAGLAGASCATGVSAVSAAAEAAGVSGAFRTIVPMLDARRMEVYTATYGPGGQRLTPVQALVVTAESFAAELAAGPVLFVGDGALKCQPLLQHPHANFRAAVPLARHMAPLAFQAYQAGRFEDVAYFEPFYLKDFVATVSKKPWLPPTL